MGGRAVMGYESFLSSRIWDWWSSRASSAESRDWLIDWSLILRELSRRVHCSSMSLIF